MLFIFSRMTQFMCSYTQTHLLCPGKNDIFLQKVSIIKVFEDDGDTRQQLDLM